jgi:hypothetical protein
MRSVAGAAIASYNVSTVAIGKTLASMLVATTKHTIKIDIGSNNYVSKGLTANRRIIKQNNYQT